MESNPNIVLIPTTPPNSPNTTILPLFYSSLYHKPRGSGGQYIPVQTGEQIRVTRAGKILKIKLRSSVYCDWSTLSVGLFQGENELKPIDGGFNVESCVPAGNELVDGVEVLAFEIEIRMYHQSQSVPVLFQISCMDYSELWYSCGTVGFFSNDSGRKRKGPSSPIVEMEPVKKRRDDPEAGDPDTEIFPHSIEVNGNVKAMGFFRFSDMRYKTDIEDIRDAFEIISELQGKSYVWDDTFDVDDVYHGERVIGLIAQEVRRVLPEVVREDENGFLSVDYSDIVPVLIEAFKFKMTEFDERAEDMEENIRDLENQLSRILKYPSLEDLFERSKKSVKKAKLKSITTQVNTKDRTKTITTTKQTIRVVKMNEKMHYKEPSCNFGKTPLLVIILALVIITLCAVTVSVFAIVAKTNIFEEPIEAPSDAYDDRVTNGKFDLIRNGDLVGWETISPVDIIDHGNGNYVKVKCVRGQLCGIKQIIKVNTMLTYFKSFTYSATINVVSSNKTVVYVPVDLTFFDTVTQEGWVETHKLTVNKNIMTWQNSKMKQLFPDYGKSTLLEEIVIWLTVEQGEILYNDVTFKLNSS